MKGSNFIVFDGFDQWVFAIENGFDHRPMVDELRVLTKIPDANSFMKKNGKTFAFSGFLSGDEIEQGGFPSTVFGDQSDFITLIDVEGQVFKKYFIAVSFCNVFESKVIHRFILAVLGKRKRPFKISGLKGLFIKCYF